jgi:hypothetical protein
MNDISQRCVSLASGVLSPDLRVNYEFGLVLGVDEFKQEQMYFLEKDYLHNRALHGYGTVYGLKVEATRPADDATDVLITVEPGLGIDQCGRPILLRNAQCARLKAWLKKQPANVVAQYTDASGDMHLYVVASYDECLEALVPIPGAPCSSGESTSAPSRIRDSFNLELRWEPPSMTAWAAVDLFARLMGHVRFVPHLSPLDSDEGRIIAFVRELDNPATVLLLPGSEFFLDSPPIGSPPDSPPESPPAEEPFLRLPAETAHEALDRIFTVWVTEVRPRIQPSLSDQCSPALDAGILLARIDFGQSNTNADIVDLGVPDDTGRPFLLHTQLIQELLFHGGGTTDIVLPPPQKELASREFVTFNTVLSAQRIPSLTLWFHTPEPVTLPQQLQAIPGLIENNNATLTFNTSAGNSPSSLWNLTLQRETPLQDKDFLTFNFNTDEILVGPGNATLTSIIQSQHLDFVGYDGNHTIQAFYEVDVPDQVVQNRPPLPFVNLASMTVVTGRELSVELWFHLDLNPLQETVGVDGTLDVGALRVFAELRKPVALEELRVGGIQTVQHNVFLASLSWPRGNISPDALHLRFVFLPDMKLANSQGGKFTLGEYIANNSITFEGYTGKNIVAYLRVPVPSQG